MKAHMNYHHGNELKIVKGNILTPSGGPTTTRVLRYDPNHGSCKVFIVGANDESWEETWNLTQRHSPERATFWRQDVDEDASMVEVTLKSA